MKGHLSPLDAHTWDALRTRPAERWLWVDTTGAGVHYQTELPARPTQVTHVWGWAPGWAVRARVDPDLAPPGEAVGVRGAHLSWGQRAGSGGAAHAQEVEFEQIQRPVWPLRSGAASMPRVAGLAEADGSRDLLVMEVHRMLEFDSGLVGVPLTFVCD